MLEGTYVVLAQTPVGSKRGEVTFSHGVNGALRAVLNVRGLNIALSVPAPSAISLALGYHLPRLDGQGTLYMHGSRLRVIDSLLPRGRVPFRSR